MKLTNLVVICCLLSLLVFCGTSPNSTAPSSNLLPGSFQLTELDGLGKRLSNNNANDSLLPNINLGSIKSSQDFYFLLQNIGDRDIDSIELSITDSAFSISPAQIQVLKSEYIHTPAAGLSPIIKISITHGDALNGIGWVGILPKGENTAILNISGKTTNLGGRDTIIGFISKVSVNALVGDLRVYGDSSEILLDSKHICGNVGDISAGFWMYCFSSQKIHFVNSGNVPDKITLAVEKGTYGTIFDTLCSDSTVQPTDSISLSVSDSISYIWMSLTCQNTVTDINRLPLNSLGVAQKVFRNIGNIFGN